MPFYAILGLTFITTSVILVATVADLASGSQGILASMEKSEKFMKKRKSVWETDVEWLSVMFQMIFSPMMLLVSSVLLLGDLVRTYGLHVSDNVQIAVVVSWVAFLVLLGRLLARRGE